ncbi:hypothetical protein HYU19_06025 [Candidatus Woesearchaeota archaeon]|nr:hypothetical protein [Candidatus Woesearchaeota archaeon]
MTYIRSERDEFVRRMKGIIVQARADDTPAQDFSRPGNPSSTYSQNLARLKDLTEERLALGEEPTVVLGKIVTNLESPYRAATENRLADFKAAGASDKDCIDALLEAYKDA